MGRYWSYLYSIRQITPCPTSRYLATSESVLISSTHSKIYILLHPVQGSHIHTIQYPIDVLELLIPYTSVRKWKETSIKRVDDQNGTLKSTESFMEEYWLPKTSSLTYSRVKSFLIKHPPPNIGKFLTSPHTSQKGIFLLYNVLQQKTIYQNLPYAQEGNRPPKIVFWNTMA